LGAGAVIRGSWGTVIAGCAPLTPAFSFAVPAGLFVEFAAA
jgi:hypothetical protein